MMQNREIAEALAKMSDGEILIRHNTIVLIPNMGEPVRLEFANWLGSHGAWLALIGAMRDHFLSVAAAEPEQQAIEQLSPLDADRKILQLLNQDGLHEVAVFPGYVVLKPMSKPATIIRRQGSDVRWFALMTSLRQYFEETVARQESVTGPSQPS